MLPKCAGPCACSHLMIMSTLGETVQPPHRNQHPHRPIHPASNLKLLLPSHNKRGPFAIEPLLPGNHCLPLLPAAICTVRSHASNTPAPCLGCPVAAAATPPSPSQPRPPFSTHGPLLLFKHDGRLLPRHHDGRLLLLKHAGPPLLSKHYGRFLLLKHGGRLLLHNHDGRHLLLKHDGRLLLRKHDRVPLALEPSRLLLGRLVVGQLRRHRHFALLQQVLQVIKQL